MSNRLSMENNKPHFLFTTWASLLQAVLIVCLLSGCSFFASITGEESKSSIVNTVIQRIEVNLTKSTNEKFEVKHNQDVYEINFFGSFSKVSSINLSSQANCTDPIYKVELSDSQKVDVDLQPALGNGVHTFYISYVNSETLETVCLNQALKIEIKKTITPLKLSVETFKSTQADPQPDIIISSIEVGDQVKVFNQIDCSGQVVQEFSHADLNSDQYASKKPSALNKGVYHFSAEHIDSFGNRTCVNHYRNYYYSGWSPHTNIYATEFAYAAIRADGSVSAWGSSIYGGSIKGLETKLDGSIPVTSIVNTYRAFAAIRADGSVVTWGDASSGGDSSSVAADLNGDIDVVQIYATPFNFYALRSDNTITVGQLRFLRMLRQSFYPLSISLKCM